MERLLQETGESGVLFLPRAILQETGESGVLSDLLIYNVFLNTLKTDLGCQIFSRHYFTPGVGHRAREVGAGEGYAYYIMH